MVNGEPAKVDAFPYSVSIIVHKLPTCGGSIIDLFHVVTAAHCLENITKDSILVNGGIVKYKILGGSFWSDDSRNQIRAIKRIHIHPDYQPAFEPTLEQKRDLVPYYAANDVAVLTVSITSLSLLFSVTSPNIAGGGTFYVRR